MEMFSIIGILSFLVVFLFLIVNIIKFYKMPAESCKAKVVSKRRSRNGANKTTSYFITFEIDNKNVEFRVMGYDLFYSLTEGMEGTIYYKGNILVDFK